MKLVLDRMLELETYNEVLDMLRGIIDSHEKVQVEPRRNRSESCAIWGTDDVQYMDGPSARMFGLIVGRWLLKGIVRMFNRGSWLSGLMLAVALGCVTASTVPPARADDEADPVPAPPAQKPESDQPPVAATEQGRIGLGTAPSQRPLSRAGKAAAADGRADRPHRPPPRSAVAAGRGPEQRPRARPALRRADRPVARERLRSAVKSQAELREDLNKLLELLLSEDRGKRIENEKERVRAYLKRGQPDHQGTKGGPGRDGSRRRSSPIGRPPGEPGRQDRRDRQGPRRRVLQACCVEVRRRRAAGP